MGEKEQTVEAETAAERGPSSSSESSQDHVSVPVAAPSTALSARSSNGSRCGSKGQRTRLVVRDIEVENFKSYYGKHRIGPFHKTFTAVIGPNGSGKSNVIDSMLFVFGRNAKKIRLEKLSELIHSSAAHPNVSFSSVAVNFVRVLESEEDERCPEQRVEMSGSHFSIRREVFRTGASQYYVDDRRSTQKEVEKRLISEGIDLEHNRFLILQGEVEQIALMKPKGEKEGEEGLLEYLDDLIGTNSLIAPIQQLSAKAEEQQTARLEALAREKKLLLERQALDDAKNSAVDFVTKENQLKKTLIVMCQLRMQTTEESLVEPRKQLSEIDARIKEYEEDLKACKEERVKAEAEVVAAKGRLGDAAAMRDTIRQQKQAQEAQLEALQSGAAEQERGRKKITDRIKKSTEDAQKAQLQQQDAEREAAIHESNLKEARETVTRLQEEHENLSSTLLPLLRPLRQKLEERRHDCAPFEEAVATAQEAVRSVKVKLSALEAAHAKSEGRLKELDEETARDRNRVEELRSNLKEAELAQQDEAQYRQLQEALLETSRRKYAINNVIQEKKSSVREGEADDRAVDFLLSQRSLKGYYGTLRQLGRIDEKYDIAAGVASNAWGFHVVEDRNTATAALTLLKNENVGRGSMMVVTEIDREMQHRMNAPFESPTPKATRLFDLIKPTNQKFRSAFYQAVRDTLVVSTLQEAREVAFNSRSGKRYRVVTLKGELVEPSGFITGGGGPPRGAKLKAARSPLDRQLIMEELKKQQAELQNAVEEERAIQLRLQELSQRRTSLTAREQKIIESELRRLMLKQEDFEKRRASVLEEVLETREAYEKKHKELLQTLQEYQAQEMEAQKEREKANASIEALEKEIEKTGGTTFSELTASLKKEQERVDLEEAALRTCRRSQEKWRAAHERRQADVAEYKEKLEKMEAEASEGVKEQVASCRITLEEIVRQLAKAETALAHEQQHTDSAKAAIPAIQSRILEAQKKVEEEMRYRQSEQSKMAHALQQLAKFEQKIEGCEQTIRNNVAQYGVETLELDPPEDSRQTEALNPDENGAAAEKDENRRSAEEDEECSDTTSDSDEEEKASRRRRRRKRPRAGTEAEGEAENGSQPGTKATLTEEEVLAIPLRLTPEKLATCDTNRCMHLANTLVAELDRLRQDIDLRAITLWWERNDAHLKAKEDYLRLKIESDRLDQELYDLKQQRRQSFMEVFVTIQAKIKEVYQMLTHGGDADLELVDANDPFEGVNFVVRPPRKPWRQIAYLSGGEKTLSSLALIFSLHHVKPTPVYVMDEIDAALDFRNVSIVANYVLGQATGAQFIIISLRNNMFELAHQLVGVCKVNDVTATLVLIPRAFQNRMRELCQSLMGKREMVETPGRKRRRSSGALASPTPSKEKLEGSRTAEEVVRNSYESGRGSVLSRASRKSVGFDLPPAEG